MILRDESESELPWSWLIRLLGGLDVDGLEGSQESPFLGVSAKALPMRCIAPRASFFDPVFLMDARQIRVFLASEFGAPVPRGNSVALGEVPRRGAIWGHRHLLVGFDLLELYHAIVSH